MAVRTNLVPNPSLEVNITDGWGPDADFTRDTSSGAYVGSACVNQVSTTGYANFTTINDGTGVVVSPNTTYTISFYYKMTVTSGQAPNVQINVGSAYGTALYNGNLSAQASYTRFSATVTTGASDTHLYLRIYNNNGSVTGLYDAFMVEAAGSAGTYFDGSTMQSGYTYAWTGTVNNSTSTEIPASRTNQYLSMMGVG